MSARTWSGLLLVVSLGSGGALARAGKPERLVAGAVDLDNGARWQVRRDPVAGVARTGTGTGIHLISYPEPTAEDLDLVSRGFLDRHAALFGARSAELVLAAVTPVDATHTMVTYQQVRGDLAVLGGHVTMLYRGPVLLVVASTAEAAAPAAAFSLDATSAERAADAALDAAGISADRTVTSSRRALVRDGAELRPAWDLVVATDAPIGRTRVVIDAATGGTLAVVDLFPREVVQVTATVAPGPSGAAPAPHGLPRWTAAADADGRADVAPGSVTVSLAGPRVAIDDALAATATHAFTVASAAGGISPLAWPAGTAPQEQLDAFVWSNRAKDYGRQVAPDLSWLDAPLAVHVNFDDGSGFPYCNAFYIPRTAVGEPGIESTHFFRAGGDDTIQCNNTASMPAVVLHEWGHGLHDHLLPAGLALEDQTQGSISEGVGDFVAASVLDDPIIPLDKLVTAGSPTQLPPRLAQNTLRYPDDLTGEVHDDGQIWSGTFWDLRTEMGEKLGHDAGAYAVDTLHANVLRGTPTWTSAYALAIGLDDDDDDASNGSPNSCEINTAFAAHGLAPDSPAPSRGSIRFQHDPTLVGDDGNISAAIAAAPGCGTLDPASVELRYAIGTGETVTLPMTGSGALYAAIIPGLSAGMVASYVIAARTTDGAEQTWPAGGSRFAIAVGEPDALASWDFEDGGAGWTHGSDQAAADDWEFGAPTGRAGDPTTTGRGSKSAGTDLGQLGDGAYDPGTTASWLESPAVDCGDCNGLSVRFRRSLAIGPGDSARVLVGDTVVWESTGEVHDTAWTIQEIELGDATPAADGLHVRFEIVSDGAGEGGGWNLDDVQVLYTPGGGGSGGSGAPSNDITGGCAAGGGGGGWAGALLLLALALGLARVLDRGRAHRDRP